VYLLKTSLAAMHVVTFVFYFLNDVRNLCCEFLETNNLSLYSEVIISSFGKNDYNLNIF
jgi:hypothetical protein